jgi:membrane associated rhomboid family serine protease
MSRQPAFNIPSVVVWVAVALFVVHLLRLMLGEGLGERLLLTFAFVPARYSAFGALLPGGMAARLWSPVTYAFLHADAVHLLVNVVWMASFGSALARRFGAARFLLLGLLAAIAAAGAHYLRHAGDLVPMIGASGAVSGMMAGTARFAFAPNGPLARGATERSHRVEGQGLVATLANPRVLAFVLLWFGVNLLFGVTSGIVPGVTGPIAWEAHIGGFLAGLFIFPLLDPVGPAPRPEA